MDFAKVFTPIPRNLPGMEQTARHKLMRGDIMQDQDYYQANPDLNAYFNSLPSHVQMFILQSDVEISTLGELMQVAEHLKETL